MENTIEMKRKTVFICSNGTCSTTGVAYLPSPPLFYPLASGKTECDHLVKTVVFLSSINYVVYKLIISKVAIIITVLIKYPINQLEQLN